MGDFLVLAAVSNDDRLGTELFGLFQEIGSYGAEVGQLGYDDDHSLIPNGVKNHGIIVVAYHVVALIRQKSRHQIAAFAVTVYDEDFAG